MEATVRYNSGYGRNSADSRPQESLRSYLVQLLLMSRSVPTIIPEQAYYFRYFSGKTFPKLSNAQVPKQSLTQREPNFLRTVSKYNPRWIQMFQKKSVS